MPAKKVSPIKSTKLAKTPAKKHQLSTKISIKKPSKVDQTAKNIPIRKKRLSSIKSTAGQSTLETLLKDKKVSISDNSKKSKVNEPSASGAVFLPNNMSLRAREKVNAILSVSTDDFYIPAQKIAYISAFCFIALGSLLAVPYQSFKVQNQAAQLVSSSSLVQNEDSPSKPQLVMDVPIPSEITESQWFNFLVPGAKSVEVNATSRQTGKVNRLAVRDAVAGGYQFEVDTEVLPNSTYMLTLLVRLENSSSLFSYDLGEFSLASGFVTESNDSIFEPDTTEVLDLLPLSNPAPAQTEIGSENFVGESFNGSVNSTFEMENLPLTVDAPVTISLNPPDDTSVIEIYLRPTQSKSIIFAGLANKINNKWQFFFNPKNTPQGKYEIYATARTESSLIESESRVITVSTSKQIARKDIEDALSVDATPEIQQVDGEVLGAETSAVTNSLRSFSDLSLASLEDTSNVNPAAIEATDVIFEDNQALLTNIFNRYAVAVQSGSPVLKEMVRQEFISLQTTFINALLDDSESVQYVQDIDTEIQTRFQVLQKRVDTFEELRKTASDEATSIDLDNDGLADFDEENLFGTEINNPDTDNDGFTDGVEVIRGFDPLTSSSETLLSLVSPKESSGFLQPELLKITSVTPVLTTLMTGDTLPVQAFIQGVGVPNSFVTLFVHSTPSVVTVKTDSDGSFFYTFEKELENGSHEIYAAITDNTGAIVAQSNPYLFIKNGEMYAEAPEKIEQVQQTPSLSETSTYSSARTTVAMGILALGIILLMLGIGMREKSSAIITKAPA